MDEAAEVSDTNSPANALARLTPACGPHHHAPGRSRAARDSHS